MKLQNGKIITFFKEEIKLKEMKNIHIPCMQLLMNKTKNTSISKREKAILIYDLYQYVYDIFGKLYYFKKY